MEDPDPVTLPPATSTPPRKKRWTRWKPSPLATEILSYHYNTVNKHPKPGELLDLANQANTTPRRVKIWFQNKRQRSKEKSKESTNEYFDEIGFLANALVISGEEEDKEMAFMYAYELVNHGRVEEKNIVMNRIASRIAHIPFNALLESIVLKTLWDI